MKLFGSAPGFLSIGVIAADFKDKGIIPEVREECIILVILKEREGKQAFTKMVGRGSSAQVVGFDFLIMPNTSAAEGSVKLENGQEGVVKEAEKDRL